MARALGNLGRHEAGLPYLDSALRIYRSLRLPVDEADVEFAKGKLYEKVGQDKRALTYFDAALSIYSKFSMMDGVAETQNASGIAYELLGQSAKAFESFTAARARFQQLRLPAEIAQEDNNLASLYDRVGQHEQALASYLSALLEYDTLHNPSEAAAVCGNVASVYYELGRSDEALTYYQRACSEFTRLGLPEYVAKWENGIGNVYVVKGEYTTALHYYELARKIYSDLNLRADLAEVDNCIGRVYTKLGDSEFALRYLKPARATYRNLNLPWSAANVDDSIGDAFRSGKQYDRALEFYSSALTARLKLKLPSAVADTQVEIGDVRFETGQKATSREFYLAALNAFEALKSPEGTARTRADLGDWENDAKHFDRALSLFCVALQQFRIDGDRSDEAWVLHGIGDAMRGRGDRRAAIAAYKLSVDLREALQGGIQSLGKDIQRSFRAKNAFAYRDLADVLIETGRLAEAQRVLDLLKDDEFNRFARAGLGQKVDLTKRESDWKRKYDGLGVSLASDQAELRRINDELQLTVSPTRAQTQQLKAAQAKVARHEDRIREWLDAARLAFAEGGVKDEPISAIQESRGDLETTLATLPVKTAAVYTVVSADGVRTLLTLPGAGDVKAGPAQNITATQLNKKIALFRTALTNPEYDPRPLGAELYDILVRPIEKELVDSGTRSVIWSLDGPLRYLPVSALYDRTTKQYLVQKFPTSLFVPALRGRLSDTAKPIKTAVGFGLTIQTTLRGLTFGALPGVQGELDQLRADFAAPIFTNGQFTATLLEARLAGKPNIVHLGTHFQLRPGDAEASFLVLGDGTAFSAKQFYELSKTKALSGVDLLVLSACDTATPIGDEADGAETESFCRIALEGGASAVLATLWPVSDFSTSLLMGKFYELRKQRPSIGKQEALRQAQRWLMTVDGKQAGARAGVAVGVSSDGLPKFTRDLSHPFAHPYYWAPFVLTGNTQ